MATTSNTATEASKMLEAALQQMDGIISGASSSSNNNLISPSPTPSSKSKDCCSPTMQQSDLLNSVAITSDNVLLAAKTLALSLQQVNRIVLAIVKCIN